ncbi:5' exonuclease Apollo [Glycine soja]
MFPLLTLFTLTTPTPILSMIFRLAMSRLNRINTLGKQDLLVEISRALQIMIWVWPQRLRTMHLLGYDGIFTTNTSFTRVIAVPVYSFSINTLEELNYVCPTIGIMPLGLPWIKKSLQKNELQTAATFSIQPYSSCDWIFLKLYILSRHGKLLGLDSKWIPANNVVNQYAEALAKAWNDRDRMNKVKWPPPHMRWPHMKAN